MGAARFRKVLMVPLHNSENQARITTADPPQYNGVAERQIAIIEAAGLAARIPAAGKYPNEVFSARREFVGRASSLSLSRIKLHGNFS